MFYSFLASYKLGLGPNSNLSLVVQLSSYRYSIVQCTMNLLPKRTNSVESLQVFLIA